MGTKPTEEQPKEQQRTWRNWSDHPLVVATLVTAAVIGTFIIIIEYSRGRKSPSGIEEQAESAPLSGVPSSAIFSPTTFQDFMNYIYRESHTSAQEDDFISRHLGKRVVWEGWVGNVSNYSEGLSVILMAGEHEANLVAFSKFASEYKADLLALDHGQRIRVSCLLDRFSAQAHLEGCQLLKVWPKN